MIAGGLPDRESMKRDEARGVGGRDERAAYDVGLVARELPQKRGSRFTSSRTAIAPMSAIAADAFAMAVSSSARSPARTRRLK